MAFLDSLDQLAALGTQQQGAVAPEGGPQGAGAAQVGGGFESLVSGIQGPGGLVPAGFTAEGRQAFQDPGAITRSALRDLFKGVTGFDPRADPGLAPVTLADGTRVRQLPTGDFKVLGGGAPVISTLRPGRAAAVGETVEEAQARTAREGGATRAIIRQEAAEPLTGAQQQEATRLFAQRQEAAARFDPSQPRGLRTLAALLQAAAGGGRQPALLAAFAKAQEPSRAELVAEEREFRTQETSLDRQFRRELEESRRTERRGQIEQGQTQARMANINRAASGVLNRARRLQEQARVGFLRVDRQLAQNDIGAPEAQRQRVAFTQLQQQAESLRQSAVTRRQHFLDNPDQTFDAFEFENATDEALGLAPPAAPVGDLATQAAERAEATQARRRVGRARVSRVEQQLLVANPEQSQRQIEEKAIGAFFGNTQGATARKLRDAATRVRAGGIDQPGLRALNIEFQNLLQQLRRDAAAGFGEGFNPAQTEEEARDAFAAFLARLSTQLDQRRFKAIRGKRRALGAGLPGRETAETAQQFEARQQRQELMAPPAALAEQLRSLLPDFAR